MSVIESVDQKVEILQIEKSETRTCHKFWNAIPRSYNMFPLLLKVPQYYRSVYKAVESCEEWIELLQFIKNHKKNHITLKKGKKKKRKQKKWIMVLDSGETRSCSNALNLLTQRKTQVFVLQNSSNTQT